MAMRKSLFSADYIYAPNDYKLDVPKDRQVLFHPKLLVVLDIFSINPPHKILIGKYNQYMQLFQEYSKNKRLYFKVFFRKNQAFSLDFFL